MPGHCNNCDLCCTLLEVKAVRKPRLKTCEHICDKGCGIYLSRPAACRSFECIWHAAKSRGETMFSLIDRPDFSHVVLGPTNVPARDTLFVHVDPAFPNAWKKGRVGAYIAAMRKQIKVVIFIGTNQWRLDGDTALHGTEDEFAQLDAA